MAMYRRFLSVATSRPPPSPSSRRHALASVHSSSSTTWSTRYYSTPVRTAGDNSQETIPPSSSTDVPPSSATHGQPTNGRDRLEIRPGTEHLHEAKARLKEWSHLTLKNVRERGDEFTARVARTFAQLGGELNRVTGYDEIEVLKRKVVEQEAKIYNAREAARRAKDAYDTAVLQRAKSQREVNDLLQRKSHWTDEDVSRFTTLVREDHAREHDEGRAKADAAAAEDAVEREFSELMRVILNRYHEEQAWSDKIRSAATYGQLAVLALNLAVFVLAIVLVEPWKRRRLAQTFERKVEEMTVQMAAAVQRGTDALTARVDEQEQMLRAALEVVQRATRESFAEDEDGAGRALDHPQEGERISNGTAQGTQLQQELLVAMTASAAVAGLVGWLARSWFG